MTISLVLMIVAILCFAADALGLVDSARIKLTPAGLAFWALATIL